MVEGCEQAKKWLREADFELCALSAEDWIGPWFKNKEGLIGLDMPPALKMAESG